jgi:predicted nucleic acid-binding protein
VKAPVLVDTGPLVALLSRTDEHHAWSGTQFQQLAPPVLTCEAVISEACFLLRGQRGGGAAVMQLVSRGVVALAFRLEEELEPVATLMTRYRDTPMSLADGCLVRMSELLAGSRVLTLDGDFRVYRKNRREAIPLITPP